MTNHTSEHRAGDGDPVIGDAPPQANTLLSNNVYDKLKQVAQIWLPALAVFYITVAPFWGLPKQEEVAGTIMALDLLLGAMLGVVSRMYANSDARFDGQIVVSPGGISDEGLETTDLNIRLDPSAVSNKNEIVVKVDRV